MKLLEKNYFRVLRMLIAFCFVNSSTLDFLRFTELKENICNEEKSSSNIIIL